RTVARCVHPDRLGIGLQKLVPPLPHCSTKDRPATDLSRYCEHWHSTRAPGSTAPVGSLILPVIVPVFAACNVTGSNAQHNVRTIQIPGHLNRKEPPQRAMRFKTMR